MPARSTELVKSEGKEIVLARVFDAPRKLVWKAWTRPEHIAKWFGPRGFTTRVTKYEFKPRGKWVYVMRGPDGTDYPCHGVFREIVENERIVTTDEFGEDHPAITDDQSGMPRGMIVTCSFTDEGDKTRVTITILHRSEEDRVKHAKMGVVDGWGSSFECMDEHLAALAEEATREMVITRVIAAPREMVFDAFVDTKNITHWWGPHGFTTTTTKSDQRPGGEWLFTMHGPDGTNYPNKVVYEEIVRPDRLIYLHGEPGGGNFKGFYVTATFDERPAGKTLVTLRMLFHSVGELAKMKEFRASEGGNQTLERLEAYLTKK